MTMKRKINYCLPKELHGWSFICTNLSSLHTRIALCQFISGEEDFYILTVYFHYLLLSSSLGKWCDHFG